MTMTRRWWLTGGPAERPEFGTKSEIEERCREAFPADLDNPRHARTIEERVKILQLKLQRGLDLPEHDEAGLRHWTTFTAANRAINGTATR